MRFKIFILVGVVLFSAFTYAAYAAEISEVTVTGVTDSSATIEWKTDVPMDATINFGLDSRVGTVRYPLFDKTDHSLKIDQLDPGTTYHFRVVSTDTEGNRSATGGFVFTTKTTDSRPPVERILEEIEELEEEELLEIKKEVDEALADTLTPPSIIGAPKVIPNAEGAEVIWTTDRESNSMVYFARESEYDAKRTNPYASAQGDPRAMTTNHSVKLVGLESATLYHFIASSEDASGLIGESADDTFRTTSELPEITNARVTRVQETSAMVSWQNGVPSKGIVEYTNTRTRATKVAGNAAYATNHSIQLNDLEFGARYSAVIRATNEAGDEVTSSPLTFVTVRDRVAPLISKVNNESTLFPGEEVKIQTIISWETDEPAYCQVFYAQGLASATGGESLPIEANPDTTHTQVIVGFASATVYQFWLVCADEASNESRSEDFVLITPVKEKSIIDIILENFEGTFGWLKNVGG
jgi:hypothetical protein